jgi:hypothetical protein
MFLRKEDSDDGTTLGKIDLLRKWHGDAAGAADDWMWE